jgi:hypothetical protein
MSAGMDIDEQRSILDRITAYRAICEQVRRSSTGSLIFGAIMLGIWYMIFGQQNNYGLFSLIYLGLAGLEISVGLINRLFPSAEGVLLDGFVLIAFGGANLARCYVVWQAGFSPPIISIVFGGYWLWTGASHVQNYSKLRKIFNPRPTSEHLRWYNGLLADIRRANPQEDPNALDMPTHPPFRALLLGNMAFLVEAGSDEILLLDREDLLIQPLELDPKSGKRLANLNLGGMAFDPFKLDSDNWRNYSEWKRAGGENVPSINFT